MDISQVAATIVSILTPLAPFLEKTGEEIAKQVGKEVWAKAKALYNTIRQRFQSDEDETARQALKLFLEDPQVFRSALETILSRKLAEDSLFRETVEQLVDEIQGFGVDRVRGRQIASGSYIAQASDHSTASVQVGESTEQDPMNE